MLLKTFWKHLAVSLVIFAITNNLATEALYGNKAFAIGGIFDIFTSTAKDKVNPQIGIHLQEAYRFTLDEINKNQSILHGFRLKEDFVTTEDWKYLVMKILMSYYVSGNAPTSVGPYESVRAARLSSGIFSGISYPIVSYGASFDEIEEDLSSYFFRTVPADSFRVMALVQLVKKLGWNYVSIISSHAQNGNAMARYFIRKVSLFDICYSEHTSLAYNAKKSDYREAVQLASADAQARGLILFTSIADTAGLLTALQQLNLTSRFQILSATGMTNYVEVTRGNEASLEGSISLEYAKVDIPKFRKHFLSLNLTSRKDLAFKLFWEQTFGCKINPDGTVKDKEPNCTGFEKLAPGKGYYPNTPIHFVIDSIYALALAYKHIIEKSCHNNAICNWEPRRNEKYIHDLVKFLRENTFVDYTLNLTNPITNKDACLVEYDILNYVKSNSEYENAKVGKWSFRRQNQRGADYLWSNETGVLFLNSSQMKWRRDKPIAVSSCRLPCLAGQISHRSSSFRKKCCRHCKPCQYNQIVAKNKCRTCQDESKPDAVYKSCLKIPRRLFKSHPTSYIAMWVYGIVSVCGILMTAFVAMMFIKNNNNHIVRASGRDLSYFILAGITLAFLVPFTHFVEPNIYICAVRVIMPGMAFCMCYSSLFLKTNRIYRIFMSAQTSVTKPPLVSPQSQLIILFCILSVQILLGIVSSWRSGNNILKSLTPTSRDYILLYCDDGTAPLLLNMLLNVVFMICCTWYAFKTRKFPKNYNESKYIGITMYITCLFWAVFLPTFFITKQHGHFIRSHLICIISILIALLNLIGLFGQKIRLLLSHNLVAEDAIHQNQSQANKE